MEHSEAADDTERQKVIYRPLPETQTFEKALKELFQTPAILVVELPDGRVIEIRSHVLAFVTHWEENPVMILDSVGANAAAVHLFGEGSYWGGWLDGADLPESVDAQLPYRYEGLNSLCTLFGKVFKKHLKLRPSSNFGDYSNKKYPNMRGSDLACDYDMWFQSYSLAMQDFLVDEAGVLSPTLEDAIKAYVRDFDFIKKSCNVRERKQTKTLPILREFALWWDVMSIPLRYFTDEAALDFCRDQLAYGGSDLGTYRRVFRCGGGGKNSAGLAGLHPKKPAIIVKWLADQINIDAQAAQQHGFDPDIVADHLSSKTGLKIIVSRRK